MAAIYDTALIRQAAGQVKSVSAQLDDEAAHSLTMARDSLDTLIGQSAEAWDESLAARLSAIRADAQRLSDIAARLRAYANLLDEADRRIADLLGKGG